ncbi:hypothetical protein D3C87_1495580 [compost metagenome]
MVNQIPSQYFVIYFLKIKEINTPIINKIIVEKTNGGLGNKNCPTPNAIAIPEKTGAFKSRLLSYSLISSLFISLFKASK